MLIDDLLIDPFTRKKLDVNRELETIYNVDNTKFKSGFVRGVPFLLPQTEELLENAQSKLHDRFSGRFAYQAHYQRDAEEFDYFKKFESRVNQDEKHRLNQTIVHNIPRNAEWILDVGCGNGWLSQAVVSDHTKVVSMDISTENPVRAIAENSHKNHFGLIADAYHVPLRSDSMDCIVASEIIEHVPDPALFVRKLFRVLKPGGKLIITTPYDEQIEYHLCVHCNQPTPSHAHLHSFNENNIRELIPENAGSWKWRGFSHKYLFKSRAYLMLNRISYSAWESLDQLVIKVWRHPMRLMMEVVK